MKKAFLLDVDHTLFDTDKLLLYFFKSLSKLSKELTFEEFIRIVRQATNSSGAFDPAKYIKLSGGDRKKMKLIFWNEKFYTQSYYKNAIDFIKKLKKVGKVFVFSEGVKKYQEAKIKSLWGLVNPDDVYISRNKVLKLREIVKKFEGCKFYLVDDKMSILERSKGINRDIVTIHMKNKRNVESKFKPDYEINKLEELFRVLKNEKS